MDTSHESAPRRRLVFISRLWCDFAILGNVAVSRFPDLGRIENRSLVEDCSPRERHEANAKWRELVPKWHSLEPRPLADFVATIV
jgi:hypothetical protein